MSIKHFAETLFSAHNFLKKEIPLTLTWKEIAFIASLLSGLLVFVILFLEPWGTDRYEAPFRNLRLSGYALSVIIPYLLIHVLERRVYQSERRWCVYHEIISKAVLIVLIITGSYFYKVYVVNFNSPSFIEWISHMAKIGLPLITLLSPFAIYLHVWFQKRNPGNQFTEKEKIIITGRNKEDELELSQNDFVYAKSKQNYVMIHYLEEESLQKRLIRSSLKELNRQLRHSIRLHRSYLVNPFHLLDLKGNARKRFATLRYVKKSIPVSPDLDESNLLKK